MANNVKKVNGIAIADIKKEKSWSEGYKEWKRQQQQESQNDI